LKITTGDSRTGSGSEQVKAQVARMLIAALSDECSAYCILSGYDRLPDSFDTDIDFMVASEDFERMPRIIDRLGCQTKGRLFHTVDHELSARSFSLGYQIGPRMIVVQADSTGDYRHYGRLWLKSDEVLSKRRLHERGFYIPAASHEFIYYLIKRLNKRHLADEHGHRLHRLYLVDPTGCDQLICRFWKKENSDAIRLMAKNDNWAGITQSLDSIRTEMLRNSGESRVQKLLSGPKRLLHHLHRLIFPTGGWIAIMGPDGSGKSAVIETICPKFRFAYDKVKTYHLRPKILKRRNDTNEVVTDPHGRAPRGPLFSIAKVLLMIADYWIGYAMQIAPAMRRSQLIVFDRYIYDLLVDSKRIRYGGPAWLLRFAAAVVPHPDVVILLDAPPEVLWSRKQEVPFSEVERQRAEYLNTARSLPFARIVDASQPLADVIRDVDDAVTQYFAQRTAKRLRLTVAPVSQKQNAIPAPGQRC
jgi:thymidylate kinase